MRKSAKTLARAAAAGAALTLVLTACSGGDEGDGGPDAGETTPTEPPEPETWPLTGLEADGSVAKDHPVLVVKFDNTDGSAPQVGVGKADLVVEELVEGGVTRLAAFYYSRTPKTVGPVRSMRTSDIGIVAPADAEIVTSGAAQRTLDALGRAGVQFHQEGAAGFYREGSRSAPYNLMTDLSATAASTEDGTEEAPGDYLAWGDAADLPEGVPATSVSANFGSRVTQWEFRDGGYHNTNSFAAEGDRFVADSVLALKVRVGDAGYADPAGNFVPETEFAGEGEAVLFHGGQAIEATWHKDGDDGQLRLTTEAGDLAVPAGHTWLELVPANNAGGRIKAGSVDYQPGASDTATQ